MMCYRDRTFCGFYKICEKGNDCERALTDNVVSKANQVKLAVSMFVDKPDCFLERENGEVKPEEKYERR